MLVSKFTNNLLRSRLHGAESGSVTVANHRPGPDGGGIRQRVRNVSDDDNSRSYDVSGRDRQDRGNDSRGAALVWQYGELYMHQ